MLGLFYGLQGPPGVFAKTDKAPLTLQALGLGVPKKVGIDLC